MIFVSTISLKESSDAVSTVKELADNNIMSIELGSDHKFPADIKKIIQIKKELGLEYTVHTFFPPSKDKFMVNIGSENSNLLKRSIKHIKRSIEFVNSSEALLYSLHPGYSSEVDMNGKSLHRPMDKNKCKEIIKNSLSEISDYANMYGIRIALENMSRLLIDAGHLNLASRIEGFSRKEEIEKVKDRIFELHISENDGIRDEHRPLSSTEMLECFNKETLKNKILTIEGQHTMNIEEIKRSMQIINSLL